MRIALTGNPNSGKTTMYNEKGILFRRPTDYSH